MTTKTDITLPPLPRHMDSVTAEEFDRRVLAWGRAAVEADREKLMRAIVEAGQRAGIIRADLEAASVTECLHILECLSQPAASPARSPADSIGFCSFDPGDRFYHAADRTWWRRGDDGMLVRVEAPAASAEPCPICFEDEPHTGTCGSSNPCALCNQPAAPTAWEQDDMPLLDDRATYPASMIRRLIREDRARRAAPVAQEPAGYMASVAQPAVGEEIHIHIEGQDVLALPLASSGMDAPRFVVHVPAQAQPIMPPLTDSMRAVLRNENDVYGDEDALYAALCDAARATEGK